MTVKLTHPQISRCRPGEAISRRSKRKTQPARRTRRWRRRSFSQQELSEFRSQLSTKFDKVDARTTKFSVIADVDLRAMRFGKEAGHNLDDVTMMVALFDADGNYVTGQKKH